MTINKIVQTFYSFNFKANNPISKNYTTSKHDWVYKNHSNQKQTEQNGKKHLNQRWEWQLGLSLITDHKTFLLFEPSHLSYTKKSAFLLYSVLYKHALSLLLLSSNLNVGRDWLAQITFSLYVCVNMHIFL